MERSMKRSSSLVAIVGGGKVGSTLAQRLVEHNLADVVLLDVVEGMPQGIALDLMEASGLEGHQHRIVGTQDYHDLKDADIVVITAGQPRRPGISRDDLLKVNAKIVIDAARQAIAHAPEAILIVVTNPLDVMTYLAWQAAGIPAQRVMGMAGILDSARFQTFIAWELGVSVADVQALVLGGHGDLMVPLVRYCHVGGVPLTELLNPEQIDRLAERTRNGGAEVVELMKTGGAYFAPASAVCLMVRAILQDQSRLIPAAVYLQGQYGLRDIFMGVPCYLGRGGVTKVIELSLNPQEMSQLHQSAANIAQVLAQAKLLAKQFG